MSQPNDPQDRLDYRETSDVTEVHAAILREHAEPSANVTPVPTWLSLLSAAALCWAGCYIGMFNGGFSSKIYNEYQSSPATVFALPRKAGGAGDNAVAELSLVALGEKVFAQNCSACHQANGAGTPGSVPPLAGSEWVDGTEANEKRLALIVLKGLQGTIQVKGATYQGLMQPWESLGPKKIAAVLTYIRQAFGNKAGEITEAQITAAKKEFASQTTQATVVQLKEIPLDAKLEGGGAPAATPAVSKDAATPKAVPTAGAAPAASMNVQESVARGQAHYMGTCASCHQPSGLGIPGAFPPLSNTEFVTGDPRRLVAITLKGIVGALTVDGKVYATGMISPAATFPVLADDKNLSDVLNYVRNSFGNKASSPITPELVGATRKEFADRALGWSEAELLNFPVSK